MGSLKEKYAFIESCIASVSFYLAVYAYSTHVFSHIHLTKNNSLTHFLPTLDFRWEAPVELHQLNKVYYICKHVWQTVRRRRSQYHRTGIPLAVPQSTSDRQSDMSQTFTGVQKMMRNESIALFS